jgi:hypothetical protein
MSVSTVTPAVLAGVGALLVGFSVFHRLAQSDPNEWAANAPLDPHTAVRILPRPLTSALAFAYDPANFFQRARRAFRGEWFQFDVRGVSYFLPHCPIRRLTFPLKRKITVIEGDEAKKYFLSHKDLSFDEGYSMMVRHPPIHSL